MDASAQETERIVVGVDGSPASVRALEWALRQAERTGASIEAVHAWEVPVMYGSGMMVLPGGDEFEAAAKRNLEQAVGQAGGDSTAVPIELKAVAGHPAKTLVDVAEHAALLVVGSRGHGGFMGALIGSVSQNCVAHAKCPVVVVREHY
ncbi:universal stress protein [Glycomyces paridis]|uniref:Universal stress protein n=1 Tax=Glycomyces paridis TaxID=2126555 RepID=A0A4S8P992_9ACTN|nr:universal stress protein [Glycomyces paridis]THV26813.1 universal stress protein [Glycomyces paridis]